MSFTPSQRWYRNWPWKQSTIVRLQAELIGDGAAEAAAGFLATLNKGERGVYYSGGYCFKEVEGTKDYALEVYSAGEDGFDSALFGAEDLEEYLADYPEITIEWKELAPVRSLH